MFQKMIPVRTIICGVRRPRTNVRCEGDLNHSYGHHHGTGYFGTHVWSAESEQLRLPIVSPKTIKWIPENQQLTDFQEHHDIWQKDESMRYEQEVYTEWLK